MDQPTDFFTIVPRDVAFMTPPSYSRSSRFGPPACASYASPTLDTTNLPLDCGSGCGHVVGGQPVGAVLSASDQRPRICTSSGASVTRTQFSGPVPVVPSVS